MSDEKLKTLPKEIVRQGESMALHTTYGVGGRVSLYVEPRNRQELLLAIDTITKMGLSYKVIGNGSNLLFAGGKLNMAVISLRSMEKLVTIHDTTICASASFTISELVLWCAKRGLSGLENLFGIPGTIGGMVVMNAGAFGTQISDVLQRVEVLRRGEIVWLAASELGYGHHSSNLIDAGVVVLAAEFKLSRLAPSVIYSVIRERVAERKVKQPIGKSAGSVFKPLPDGTPAAMLIDGLGLKGTRIGGALVSSVHANFILNDMSARPSDIKRLTSKVQRVVKEKTGFALEREIEYVGGKDADNWGLSHPL